MKRENPMTNVTLKALRESLNANVIARTAYEDEKNPANTIGNQLARHFAFDFSKSETRFSDDIMKATRAMGVASFDFINSHVRQNQRMNVKAFEKVSAHLRSVAQGRFIAIDKTAQKYCIAILRDLLGNESAYRAGDITLDSRRVQAMYSIAARSDALASYEGIASMLGMQASTASTQASSSLRALDSLRVLDFHPEIRGKESVNVVTWVNWDHPLIALARDLFDIPAKQA
jgi:hypothetical protein